MPQKSTPISSDLLAQILLGEAAGEGPQGMSFIRDVLVNRARQQKKTLEEVAMQPHQFSDATRPDLAAFAAKQPIILQNLARELIAEGQRPEFIPTYKVTHYVTRDLYDRRFEPHIPSWIRQMEPTAYIGNHVALRERKR